MAKEIKRTFDSAAGAVSVELEDSLRNRSVHTFYLLAPGSCPACGKQESGTAPLDFEAALLARHTEIDARAEALRAALTKAGWGK